MLTSFFSYYNKEKHIIITEDHCHLREKDHLFNDKNTIIIRTNPWFFGDWQMQNYLNTENKNHYYLVNSLEELALINKFTENAILCHQNSIMLNENFYKIDKKEKNNRRTFGI